LFATPALGSLGDLRQSDEILQCLFEECALDMSRREPWQRQSGGFLEEAEPGELNPVSAAK